MEETGITIGVYSIIGDRSVQQDSCVCERSGSMVLAAVCDGMGGLEGGEFASRTGISVLTEFLKERPPESIELADEWLREAFSRADARVSALTDKEGKRMNAGSTLVAVIVSDSRLQWGCVGDSSIFMVRDGEAKLLTRMHNYNLCLDEMLQRGEIDLAERGRQGERGEALISYLGINGLPLLDTAKNPIQLQDGDVILLCSDGLYKSLDIEQIKAIIEESGGNMQIASKRLCEEAYRLCTRKQDNTTAVILRYIDDERI